MGVKAFSFDQGFAAEAEAPLATVCGRLLEHTLLGACGSREDKEFAVREDSIYVEKQEFDFAGTGLSGESGHRRGF